MDALFLVGRDNGDQTQTQVECLSHILLRHTPQLLNPSEERRPLPGLPINIESQALRKNTACIACNSPPCVVREPSHPLLFFQTINHRKIGSVNGKQGISHAALQLFNIVIHLVVAEDHLLGKGVAIGVESSASDTDQQVALPGPAACDQFFPVHNSNNCTGQIELSLLVDVVHLRCFATDQCYTALLTCRSESPDHIDADLLLQFSRREVVQEEEGSGAADSDIVYAVVDKILADGIVAACSECYNQFSSDAVNTAHKYRLLVARQVGGEEGTESADIGEDLVIVGFTDHILDGVDQIFTCFNINAGVSVGMGFFTHN